jgi:iron(III) transport system permease protein
MLVVGFSVPGTVLALGLLEAYDRPSLARAVPASLLVMGALFARYQILVHRGVLQTMLQIPKELWESAAVEGAGLVQMLRHVFVPMTAFPLAIITVIFLVLAFNELGSTILLYPPGGETLPIALYSIEANSPRSYVAALALINLGVLLIPCAVVSVYAAIHHRRQA